MIKWKQLLTSVKVTPGWQKCHVEGDISHSRVRLKDGDDGNLHEDEEHWMLPVWLNCLPIRVLYVLNEHIAHVRYMQDLLEFDGERDGVKKDIDLEDTDEEETEMLKHLCKEVPEESDVWSQVWNRKSVEYTHSKYLNITYVFENKECGVWLLTDMNP